MDKRPNYPVLTLVKALEIIELLAKDSGSRGLGVSELSRALNMGKSTVHRILDTLAYFKYVEKNEATEKYKLSWGLFYAGQAVPQQNQFSGLDYKILEELSEECGETVNFGVRTGNETIVIAKFDSKTNLKAGPEIGVREPLHDTARGKILIQEMDRATLLKLFGGEILPRRTPRGITVLDDLIRHLAEVRRQGFAVDDEESSVGVRCIAMPVRDYTGRIVAAISVTAPSLRMDDNKMADVKESLAVACKKISRYLGTNV